MAVDTRPALTEAQLAALTGFLGLEPTLYHEGRKDQRLLYPITVGMVEGMVQVKATWTGGWILGYGKTVESALEDLLSSHMKKHARSLVGELASRILRGKVPVISVGEEDP